MNLIQPTKDMTEKEMEDTFNQHIEALFRIAGSLLASHDDDTVSIQATFKDEEGNNNVIRVRIDNPPEDEIVREDDAA